MTDLSKPDLTRTLEMAERLESSGQKDMGSELLYRLLQQRSLKLHDMSQSFVFVCILSWCIEVPDCIIKTNSSPLRTRRREKGSYLMKCSGS